MADSMRDENIRNSNAVQMPQAKTTPNIFSIHNIHTQVSDDDATRRKSKRIVEMGFSELPDGTIVEMIENPRDASKSLLAIWNNGQVRYAEKLKHGNQVLVPFPKDLGIIRHVRLAKGAESYESVETLLADIMLVFILTLDLPIEETFLLSSFVLSTWLVEKLPIAPYVALLGPPGSGKTSALRILNLLCRRSLLTADISSAAFYELCDRMTSTVLIDETATVSNRRELLHLLRAGSTQGFVAIRKGNSFRSYGARVISWLELPNDAALNSRCVVIPMKSTKRVDLLLPTDSRILHLAERIQQQLLHFRFKNYNSLVRPTIPGEAELSPRTRDLFCALALPLIEDKESCERLVGLLKQQESVREVLSVYQSAALESLYSAIHLHPTATNFTILELTEIVNANLQQMGESGRLSERKFSNILSSLSLTDRTRRNCGYVLWLNRKTREKIHSLARSYCLNTGLSPEMSAQCELCKNIGHPRCESTTRPIAGSESSEPNDLRERNERSEHGRRRIKRRPPRAVSVAKPRRP